MKGVKSMIRRQAYVLFIIILLCVTLLTLGIIGVFSMAFVEYILLASAFMFLMTSGCICVSWFVFLKLEEEKKPPTLRVLRREGKVVLEGKED